MLYRNSRFLILIIAALCILFVSLTVGTAVRPDTLNYFNLGKLLSELSYKAINKEYAYSPIFYVGPVYSIFLYQLSSLGRFSSFIISTIQLAFLLFSSYLIFQILSKNFPIKYAIFGTILYLLLPFNILYATFLLAESVNIFLLTIFIYYLQPYIRHRHSGKLAIYYGSHLILVSSLLALTRFVFVPLSILADIYFGIRIFFFIINKVKTKKIIGSIKIITIFNIFLGIGLQLWWLNLNFMINGNWSFTNVVGRNQYIKTVSTFGLLPNPNDQLNLEFYSRIPKKENVIQPWWELNKYFQDLSESSRDRLFLDFSLSAIRAHPVEYAVYTLVNIGVLPLIPAMPRPPDDFYRIYSSCTQICDMSLAIICQPLLPICTVRNFWQTLVLYQFLIYPYEPLVLLVLALAGMIRNLITKDQFLLTVSIIFIFILFITALGSWADGRYFLVLYPIYILLIINGIYFMFNFLHVLWSKLKFSL